MSEREPEKETVYRELERTQHKCARLKREVDLLRKAVTGKENAALRKEAANYRKALSNIAHRLDNGGVDDETLRAIVESALLLRGLKVRDRRKVAAAWDNGGSET